MKKMLVTISVKTQKYSLNSRHEKIFIKNFKRVISKFNSASLTGGFGLLMAMLKVYFYANKYLVMAYSAKSETKRARTMRMANYYTAVLLVVGFLLNLIDFLLVFK